MTQRKDLFGELSRWEPTVEQVDDSYLRLHSAPGGVGRGGSLHH
jgi:hypothetical protein